MATGESGREKAEKLLNRLLDRFERLPDRKNRIVERLPAQSYLHEVRTPLYDLLQKAEGAGAIEIGWGKRDNRHNIEYAALTDSIALYALLGRQPIKDAADAALQCLTAALPDLPPALTEALQGLTAAWQRNRNLIPGLGPADTLATERIFRAVVALCCRDRRADIDMRTFSRRATGDSKFVEGNKGRIVTLLRMVEDVGADLTPEEALDAFGVRTFPQACLLAGPIAYKGAPLPTEPYIGIAPEMAADLELLRKPDWILTIENLASFNRQVREARGGGVVIYTGGFPSEPTLTAIVTLAAAARVPVYHWGDIDDGGLKIAYQIEQRLRASNVSLKLHQMTVEVAAQYGVPTPPTVSFKHTDISESSVVRTLASFLASAEARKVEQEELEPIVPEI